MNLLAKKILGAGSVLVLATAGACAQSASEFANLPLWFEASQPAMFVAHASDSQFSVSATGAEFTLAQKTGETAGCRLQLVGANPEAHLSGDRQLTGTINYLIGSNPNQWQANIPTFAQVRVENVYPGINVVYYGNRQKLEYDFNLAAGVDPSLIALRFDGAKKVSVNPQGELVIQFNSGEVRQHAPLAYQTLHGVRQEIASGYKILDAHTAAFTLGHYDHSESLVIDPVLSYCTCYGGNYSDNGWAIAVNPIDGSIYVAGQTLSTQVTNNIPFSTAGAFQTASHGGKLTGDAFIARFDATGTNLIYATYLGGSGNDGASSLAVDNAGNAYFTGYTDSTNFPTSNALNSHIGGVVNKYTRTYPVDAFVAELNPAGNGLVYSTYLGGSAMDAAYGIALDESGNAYVTGYTYSTNFPVTPNAFQPHLVCTNSVYINANAFVAEISAGGTKLNYSTYLGGTNFDTAKTIAYNSGKVFVAGFTSSTNFPVTNYIPRTQIIETNIVKSKTVISTNYFTGRYLNGSTDKKNWDNDAFVTAFDASSPTNLTLIYSTLLGGTNTDQANGIVADASGNAYVVGYTCSTNFPDTLPGLIISYVHTNILRYTLITNGFLTKIEWDGTNTSIGYSAMFGGKGLDVANGLTLDPAGNVYVVGSASSTNYPVTPDNLSGYLTATNSSQKKKGYIDAVITAFNADASALLYSAYLGGRHNDFGNGIAVDPLGNAYIVGQTFSTNFPTLNARQTYRNGSNDMFIAKISQVPPPVPTLRIAPGNLTPSAQSKIAGLMPVAEPGVTLTWQMFPADPTIAVEGSTDLTPDGWHVLPTSPVYNQGWYNVTVPATNGMQFFRLRQH